MPVTRIVLNHAARKTLLSAVSKDDSRPALHHVHLAPEFAEATTGHIAVRLRYEPQLEGFQGGLFLHRETLKGVKAKQLLIIDTEEAEAWIGEDNGSGAPCWKEDAIAVLPGAVLKGDAIEYPSLDNVWPSKNGKNTRRLALGGPILEALATIAKQSPSRTKRLVLEIPKHETEEAGVMTAVSFRVVAPNYELSGLAMPMRMPRNGKED